jgi:REP element-mobilizing transposase RayT
MRKLRYVPQEGTLVEVTCRTLHSRLLMRPSPEVCEIVVGVLGRAQELYPVTVCGVVCLSNHYHLLLVVPDAHRLSQFMLYVNSNLARELGRLIGWREKFWSRRYQAIVVSDEEAAQVDRLRYLLSHGCKERLVSKVREWPGVHCARALLDGTPLTGYWFNRTRESAARIRGENPERLAYATPHELRLSPLPCWRHLAPEEIRQRVTALVQEIEEEAARDCRRRGVVPLGVRAILAQSPHARPENTKRSSAPPFHAATKVAREAGRQAYAAFVLAFREGAEKLRRGTEHWRGFPDGCFPPAPSFVRGGLAGVM